jgi:hypothetical protein
LLDASRYVYLETSMSALLSIAKGRRSWSEAFEDGSVRGAGDPHLLNRVPTWFVSVSDALPASTVG